MCVQDSDTVFTTYVETVLTSPLRAQTGVISKTSAIIPYLSVRANIYIDGPEHDLSVLPPELKDDIDFLNSNADNLNLLQRLVVEFFRSVLAQKKLIIIADILTQLSGPEATHFLTVAQNTARNMGVSVVLLTTDSTLAAQFPENTVPFTTQLIMDESNE
jgi:ABC-type lipoprotein export system ATPase subunit